MSWKPATILLALCVAGGLFYLLYEPEVPSMDLPTRVIEARDFDTIEVSQQCVVVIGEDDAQARESLEKAKKIYGGHMGGGIEEHGIWGSPEAVIEGIERHRALGCSLFVIEFFGRDTTVPARLFAETVMPAFAD